MSNNYRPQGSEKIQDPDKKLDRIREIAGIGQKPALNEHKMNTKFSTVLHEAIAADGNTYGLVQEGAKVYLKRLVNDHYEYLTGDEKDYAYKDFANAFKHMNFVFKDISERCHHEGSINIYEGVMGEKKNLTEKFVLKTPQAQPPVSQDVAPIPAPAGMPPSGDVAPPQDPQASQQLDQELGGVEGQVDANDPAKAIQKMVGKLTQQMRTVDENIMTSDFMKSILNSVISALDVKKFEDADLLSIVKKLKGEENPEQAGDAQPSGESDEFKNPEGIDYNVNNPANAEGGEEPLKEIDAAAPVKYEVNDPIEIIRPISTFREVFNKGLKGTVRAVSDDGNIWLDLEDGREVGWVQTDFVTKQGGRLTNGGLHIQEGVEQEQFLFLIPRRQKGSPVYDKSKYYVGANVAMVSGKMAHITRIDPPTAEAAGKAFGSFDELPKPDFNRGMSDADHLASLQEELNQPTWDDQPMQSAALPPTLAKVVQDTGHQINETNVGDLVSAINYFVYENGGAESGNEMTQELVEFAKNIGTADMQGTNVTVYSELSPMGQDIVDGLEDMAEPAEYQNTAAPNNPQFQMAQTSASPAMAAEATSFLKDKIMEALKTK